MVPSISKAAGKKPVGATDEETLTNQSTKKLRSQFKEEAARKKTVAAHDSSRFAPSDQAATATGAGVGSCTANAKVAKKRKEQDDTIANLERTLANLRAEVALNRKHIAAFEIMVKRAFLSRLHLICMLDIEPEEAEENRIQSLVANWLSQVAAMMQDPPPAEVKTLMLVRLITQSDTSCKEWPGVAAEAIEELVSGEELQTCGGKLLMVLASLHRG